jgi:hypothetical protein
MSFAEKPHMGRIEQWLMLGQDAIAYVVGLAQDNPVREGHYIRTSAIVARDGAEIETMNSRYTLGEPANPTPVVKIIEMPALLPDQEAYLADILSPKESIDMTTVIGAPKARP